MRRAWSVAVYPRFRDRVLLIKHARLGVWLPPGGECEAGETPLEAATRELREETGLEGRFPSLSTVDGTPPGLIGYEEHVAGSKGVHMNFVFVADVDREDVPPNREFTEHRWVASAADLEAPPNVGQLAEIALGRDPMIEVARNWLRAFNARDLDALLALYADDAVHHSPKLANKSITGKAAMRQWWGDAFERLPGLRYEERALTASRERVFMEYVRVLPGSAPLDVAEVLHVRDGLIRESRVYHG